MASSKVVLIDNRPKLSVQGKIIPECAYVTYFDERNRYQDFAKNGYRLFSVTVSLASRPINSRTGFSPYQKGVFDNFSKPDFSCIDSTVKKIISVCPDAYIFPRIFVTMPKWWCDKNQKETIKTPDGEVREMLVSKQFRVDAAKMLEQVIAHIKESDYADNIIGYQVAGGGTEEWFHFDLNGGYCENVKPYFEKYLKQNYPNEKYDKPLPDLNKINGEGEIGDKQLERYLEFSNIEVAKTILSFAKTIKNATDYKQTVGVFYGYTMEICSGLFGDLAIEYLIDKKEIDFFCSPNSYVGIRKLGVDWGDMIATGSVKSHGKLCFLECDIRTSLTDYINNCRPGADKNNMYYGDIWMGPKTIKNSVYAMRKSFAHQYTKGNGMWWFDMWGGWYDHKQYMSEVKKCLTLYSKNKKNAFDFSPQIALFADGGIYNRQCIGSKSCTSQFDVRNVMGNTGVPYESYLLSDFESQYKNYKAVVFAIPLMTLELQKAISICERENIPYLLATIQKPVFTTEEIRDLAEKAGAWVFCESDDVIYCGNGLLGIHAANKGEKIVKLPKKCKIKNLNNQGKMFISDEICVNMAKFETQLFVIENI